jgi:hypothetical protein
MYQLFRRHALSERFERVEEGDIGVLRGGCGRTPHSAAKPGTAVESGVHLKKHSNSASLVEKKSKNFFHDNCGIRTHEPGGLRPEHSAFDHFAKLPDLHLFHEIFAYLGGVAATSSWVVSRHFD